MDRTLELLDSDAKKYGLKRLAYELNKAESTLGNELREAPGHKTGLRTAFSIWKTTRKLESLDRIEKLLGRVAFPIPTIKSKQPAQIMSLVAQTSKEYSETIQAIAQAIKDGSVTVYEAQDCMKETEELISACMELAAHLRHIIEAEDE